MYIILLTVQTRQVLFSTLSINIETSHEVVHAQVYIDSYLKQRKHFKNQIDNRTKQFYEKTYEISFDFWREIRDIIVLRECLVWQRFLLLVKTFLSDVIKSRSQQNYILMNIKTIYFHDCLIYTRIDSHVPHDKQ